MSNPTCQDVAQRKVNYDKCDRQPTRTRFQPRQPTSGRQDAAAGGTHRPGGLVVHPDARHCGTGHGRHGRAASGTNLDPRHRARNKDLKGENRKVLEIICCLRSALTPALSPRRGRIAVDLSVNRIFSEVRAKNSDNGVLKKTMKRTNAVPSPRGRRSG